MDYKLRISDGLDKWSGEAYLVLNILPQSGDGRKEASVETNQSVRIMFDGQSEQNDILEVLESSGEKARKSGREYLSHVFSEVADQIQANGLEKMLQK